MSYFGSNKNNYKSNDKENNFGDPENEWVRNNDHGFGNQDRFFGNNDYSFSNVKEVDHGINDTKHGGDDGSGIHNIGGYGEDGGGADGNTGMIEKKEFKELEIYDPLKKSNIDFIPAIIKVPVAVDDPTILEKKKLISDKEKFLGMGIIPFIIMISIIVVIIIAALAGLIVSVVLFITATNVNYLWKIFGMVTCSLCIVICIAALIFLLIYAYRRSKKVQERFNRRIEKY